MPAVNLKPAIQFAIDHESTWDRRVDGVWGVHQNDPALWNRASAPYTISTAAACSPSRG
jgi:hypothetical protein